MFVDASAMVAVLSGEPAADRLAAVILASGTLFTSPIAIWESVAALTSQKRLDVASAREIVGRFIVAMGMEILPLGIAEQEAALDAYASFGKGRHPARLNLGDCFSYAAARTHKLALLAVGEDFKQTDAKIVAY